MENKTKITLINGEEFIAEWWCYAKWGKVVEITLKDDFIEVPLSSVLKIQDISEDKQ